MANCRPSPVVQQTLDLNYMSHKKDASFKWSLVNGCLLSIILYDLSFKCSGCTTYFNYFEYLLVVILGSNTLYHTVRYLYLMCTISPVVVTPKQKELLGFKDADSSFKLKSDVANAPQPQADLDISMPFSLSSRSWMTSNSSPNTSRNSVTSSSWMFQRGSPAADVSTGPRFPSNFATSEESIADEQTLHEYLRKYEEKQNLVHNSSTDSSPKDLSSFWRHPSSRSPNEVSPGFRRTLYQLAPLNSAQQVTKGGSEEGSPSSLQNSPQLSWSLQHDAHHLTQWNLNLRLWISRTILERVVKEINNIDENLQKHGLPDVKIGFVGLERLKKTAQTSYVMQHIPTLPTLVPFLEISNNQEYLVQRIKELSKGGCMSEFKWKAGGSLHDKSWDDTLPTDSAIIMHFFATYLDTQLLPVNQNPDSRPFTSQHFCKAPEKPQRSASALIIHQLAVHPPHFVLVDGEHTIEVAKGRNNLIHTILLFLHTVATKHHGMLGRVNLGKSGVNILWVIDR